MKPLILAVIILVVMVIVAMGYSEKKKKDTAAKPAAAAAAAAATMYNIQAPAAIWDPSGVGAYTCANTLASGYCVVPTFTGPSVCSSDSKCIGFIQESNDPTKVQLLSTNPVAMAGYNAVFYKKVPSSA